MACPFDNNDAQIPGNWPNDVPYRLRTVECWSQFLKSLAVDGRQRIRIMPPDRVALFEELVF